MVSRGPRRVDVPLLALAIVGLLAMLAALAAPNALAQQPTAPPLPTPFDPRGGGSGPGLVGSPFLVALGVVLIGVLAATLTGMYVRLTRRR